MGSEAVLVLIACCVSFVDVTYFGMLGENHKIVVQKVSFTSFDEFYSSIIYRLKNLQY